MKTLQRLARVGYDTTTLRSTDLRLWSERRQLLQFLLKRLCGDDELLLQVLELSSKDLQFEDEMHRTAKAFHRVFSTFQLDHLTLANILGESPDCNVFLDSVLDLAEIMQSGTDSESEIMVQKKKPDLSALDGFMSNFALLDCASLRIKDLTKEEVEIFPANLKQEASQFHNTMDTNLEHCFTEILSQTESIKRQLLRRQLTSEDAQSILKKYSNDQDQSIDLHQLEKRLEGFIQSAQRFINEIPNCIETKEENMKGIERHAKATVSTYEQLVHISELLKNTSITLRDLETNAKREEWSNLQTLFRDIEMQFAMIKPRSNRA